MARYKYSDPVDQLITEGLGSALVLGALAIGFAAYEGIQAAQRASRRPIPHILSFLALEQTEPAEVEVPERKPSSSKSVLLGAAGFCLVLGLLGMVTAPVVAPFIHETTDLWECLSVLVLVAAPVFVFLYFFDPEGRPAKVSRKPPLRETLKNSVTLGLLDTIPALKPLVVPTENRFEHMHILGATGSGKSTLMANMIIQDMYHGYGLCVIDPAGTLIEQVLPFVPKERVEDTILFDVANRNEPLALNLLERVPELEDAGQQADEVISVFIKLFGTSWGPRLEHILTKSIFTLLHFPGATLLDIDKLLMNEVFRRDVVRYLTDPEDIEWWTTGEYAQLSRTRDHILIIQSILNKVGPWRTYPTIKNIVKHPQSTFNLSQVMRENKILLVNLNKGKVGRRAGRLLGATLVTMNLLAALARADIQEKPPFFLYVDEFYDFVTTADDIPGAERDPFQELLAQARKSNVGLIVANQEQMQLSQRLCATLDGNVGTRIRCRKHQERDKDGTVKQEWWTILVQELQNPEARKAQKDLELEEDEWGQWLYPFSPPIGGDEEIANAVRDYTRRHYARPVSKDDIIKDQTGPDGITDYD